MKLSEIREGLRLKGLTAEGIAEVRAVTRYGDDAVDVVYEDPHGNVEKRLLYEYDADSLQLAEKKMAWTFDGDGGLLRLVSEAYRIHLAWLFDPYTAVSTSVVEPLPHQISAVYEEMLPRQPLRFLLADDPGAGKTIMAGLLIKELIVRGDLERCLIVAPGSVTEQWQDELWDKFGLHFDLLSRDMIESARSGNPFDERPHLIARMDQLSRNEDLQHRLSAAQEWDLVVCDEAHRMSAHYTGNKLKRTKRYELGQRLAEHCRNQLLMTATPHNGKNDDFQLFLGLLDPDRFEGKYREGVHTSDPSDLMRRMVKEDLVYFDGRPLFPERVSKTVQYALSDLEKQLYEEVTAYVRDEMNRAERFVVGQGQRRVNVGFALQTLQRRLASSPKAIFRSIERRRDKLEERLAKVNRRIQLGEQEEGLFHDDFTSSGEDWDEYLEDASFEDREEAEDQVMDLSTAAATVEELETEIERLKELRALAKKLYHAGTDTKWKELNTILDDPLMVDESGNRRKLVVFTEFRDTLTYLADKIRTRIGKADAVIEIHGGVRRETRREHIHGFMNDPSVLVLVANDAAGEGVNLQRAHLMVNYDLPWNPNRLEQRFGRIHRIGQPEVCHLWNLIALGTREGDVYQRLLTKLEEERKALGGKVFDVLGQLFEGTPLRDLLMDAIRHGNDPAVRARLTEVVDKAVDRKHLEDLLERRALVQDSMDTSQIRSIKGDMERALSQRLQPHLVRGFFVEAFRLLGGRIHPRESGRYEVSRVPGSLRERSKTLGLSTPILRKYERICFEKEKVEQTPRAQLVCPGNPLLDATIDLLRHKNADLLRQGAVLVDENDEGDAPRLLFYLEHAVQDGRLTRTGRGHIVSRKLLFLEVGQDGEFTASGAAPYLDYRPASESEQALVLSRVDEEWVRRDWEKAVMEYAIHGLVAEHIKEVRDRRLALIEKVEGEVRKRLRREITHWDRKAQELKSREAEGKKTHLPWLRAQERADKLEERLKLRLVELERERTLAPQTPQVKGGALVVPLSFLQAAPETGAGPDSTPPDAEARKRVELLAMAAVMKTEKELGRVPKDVSSQKGLGYDIESVNPETEDLYFIEVKGRAAGNDYVTLTKNEIVCALNQSEKFRLAVVVVEDDQAKSPVYVRDFDYGEPGFAMTSSTYNLSTLLSHGGPPA